MSKIKALTKKQLETLKLKLIEEKELLLMSFQGPAEELGIVTNDSKDEVESAIDDYNRSHLLRFRNREAFYLKKVDKALKKFEKNDYGLCCDCGDPIKFERLLARPTADLCILCKEESERDESSTFLGRQSKSFSKVSDLSVFSSQRGA